MSQRDEGVSAAPRRQFSCPSYDPIPGTRRCRDYLRGGGCSRPDENLCVEWLRANAPVLLHGRRRAKEIPPEKDGADDALDVHAFVDAARQFELFPIQRSRRRAPRADAQSLPRDGERRAARVSGDAIGAAPTNERQGTVTPADVQSFVELGVHVCLTRSDGEFWLVPEYTGKDRREISAADAAVHVNLCAAFGARISVFKELEPQTPTPTLSTTAGDKTNV